MYKRAASLFFLFLLLFPATPVSAQTATPPPGPVYIVVAGDTLWDIASRFNVNVADIQSANNMAGGDIFPGEHLIIPGLEGLSGTLITQPVPFGETLRSLSREYRIDPATLRKLNHLVSPTELYAGYPLIILQQNDQTAWSARTNLAKGETLLELAVRDNTDPWTVAQINGLAGPSTGLPGDILYLPSGNTTAAPSGLPTALVSATVDPLPLVQGTTAQIKVVSSQAVTLGGMLVDHPLHFFSIDDKTQVALQGVHAMLDPGLYPLRLDVTLADGSIQSFEQMVLVNSGNFPNDPPLEVDPSTIDPAVTGPEDQWLLDLTSPVTPETYWQAMFQLPVDSQYCVRSGYGDRRTYNGGALKSFHTGLDFGVCSQAHPLDIYAAADGVVVFTGLKTVRGNATIIDHGRGVYTAYYHQAEIYVAVGDHVTAGQLIGKIGATGRVTGPHLHFEVWVNGIQVNPNDWLNQTYPH
ncbi:MAG TPA: peptidoglycan DD-metalloendopeptidase family protein [Anaerolineales bacterium]|nr:peptidoglycan DD-metalloendopeptidase family protein [Anaerolineales bacterium]